MTRPDEIAALAERLHAASCALLRGDDAVEHVPAICDAEQALRASATSPGDAVREKIALTLAEKYPADYARHGKPNRFAYRIADALSGTHALAPAEKAGAKPDAWVVQLKYGPDHWSGDMLTDVLPSDTETYRIIRPLYATPTPPRADVADAPGDPAIAIPAKECLLTDDRDHVFVRASVVRALIQSAAQGGGTERLDGFGSVQDGRKMSTNGHGAEQQNICSDLNAGTQGVTAGETAPSPSDPAQEPEAVAWQPWPFVEAPGEFTIRLRQALEEYGDLLAAVRYVLIEQPPTLRECHRVRPVSLDREAIMSMIEKYVAIQLSHEYTNGTKVIGIGLAADAILALIEGRT